MMKLCKLTTAGTTPFPDLQVQREEMATTVPRRRANESRGCSARILPYPSGGEKVTSIILPSYLKILTTGKSQPEVREKGSIYPVFGVGLTDSGKRIES